MSCDNINDNLRNNRKQQKKWTGGELRLFIEMLEVREPIWNFKFDGYRNRNEKEKCWSEIAAATNHCISDCKAQFNAVRSRYNAEHKKINTSKIGQGGATYVLKYEYFAALHFLDTVRNRGSGGTESNFEISTNFAFEDWDDVEEQFQNSVAQCSLANTALENSTPAKRRKVQKGNEIDSKRSEVYEKLGQFLSQKVSQGKEDISWQKGYGEYVGQQLSAYSESDARRLRTQINNVIDSFEAQQNN